MRQILFNLPWVNIPVYGYGVMLVIAFLACVQVGRRLARRFGLDGELFVNATLIALVTGLIGARLSHVLENWSWYTNPNRSIADNILDAINIRSGGLTYYGGFLLATPCCIFYAIKHRLPLLRSMDIVAPIVMVGLGFGRIGCFLNGCCYGAVCSPTMGVRFPYDSTAYQEQYQGGRIYVPSSLLVQQHDGTVLMPADRAAQGGLGDLASAQRSLPVLPTQLYSSLTAFLLCALLVAYLGLPHVDGRVFALMMMLEGPARFMLEMLRVEPAVFERQVGTWTLSMSLSMILGAGLFVAGLLMWSALALRRRPEVIFLPAR